MGSQIEKIANHYKIQSAEFTPLCLGRSRVTIKEGKDEVYFVVVKSPRLVQVRKAIEKLYLHKGGEPSLFQAEAFWPHVTVGFTIRDVFLIPDGVYKGLNTCILPVKLVKPKIKHHYEKEKKKHYRHE